MPEVTIQSIQLGSRASKSLNSSVGRGVDAGIDPVALNATLGLEIANLALRPEAFLVGATDVLGRSVVE